MVKYLYDYPLSDEAFECCAKIFKLLKKDKLSLANVRDKMGMKPGSDPMIKQRIFLLGWLLAHNNKYLKLRFGRNPLHDNNFSIVYWIDKRGNDKV